ncbi:MAG: hypothetical protein MI924_09175 [Chloroflexales bacterium]|nr:hypothetical protein [Chloroflexales bacterium]
MAALPLLPRQEKGFLELAAFQTFLPTGDLDVSRFNNDISKLQALQTFLPTDDRVCPAIYTTRRTKEDARLIQRFWAITDVACPTHQMREGDAARQETAPATHKAGCFYADHYHCASIAKMGRSA